MNLVVLTGAGISAESGIRTFRDQNGLWENHRVEDVASLDGFRRNPERVQNFYNARRTQLLSPEVAPNPAHSALAELEKSWSGGDFLLVTQNVDDLHERAGSSKLIHMHGELLKARCVRSGQVFEWKLPIEASTKCPCCAGHTLRPHIVWFGEMPFEMDRIYRALEACDVFLSIGTSGNVYPAAGFVAAVPEEARKIEVNLERSQRGSAFGEHRLGKAGEVVPELVRELLAAL